MTKEEAIMVLKNEQPHCGKKALFPEEKKYEAYDVAIKTLEQEPCDDCVRRQEVLDILKDEWNKFSDANDAMQESIDTIEALKPVMPQPMMGRWIDEGFYAEGHSEHAYRCSECDEHYIGYVGEYKYCPNCGARMIEPSESEKIYSASEAIAKIKEYEEKQKQTDDEIKVGDEVIYCGGGAHDGLVGVVIGSEKDWREVRFKCSWSSVGVYKDTLRKTGRHFPQIEEVLEQMKGEEEC